MIYPTENDRINHMIIDEKRLKKETGLSVRVVDECASTFDEIGAFDAIIAKRQTCGVGRGDHSFFSPYGGIYLVMRITGLDVDAHTLTPSVGLAVRDAIKSVTGRDASLKWVNDVMLDGKKLCGILCKSPRRGEYLIGVGINYSTDTAEFEKAGLSDIATTLDAPEMTATDFCAALINNINELARKPFDCKRYNKLCATLGKTVEFTYNGETMRGLAERVERDGSLIVKIGSAAVAVDAGEVSIVRSI